MKYFISEKSDWLEELNQIVSCDYILLLQKEVGFMVLGERLDDVQ